MGYNLRQSTLAKKDIIRDNKKQNTKLNNNHDDSESDSELDSDDINEEDDKDPNLNDPDYNLDHISEDEDDVDYEDEYETGEDTDEDTDEEDEEDEDDDDDHKCLPVIQIMNTKNGITFKIGKRRVSHRDSKPGEDEDEDEEEDEENMVNMFSDKETKYWKTLSAKEKLEFTEKFKEIKDKDTLSITPLKFKILSSNMDAITKQIVLSKIDEFNMMSPHSSEYFKSRRWLNEISRLPLGVYHKLPIANNASTLGDPSTSGTPSTLGGPSTSGTPNVTTEYASFLTRVNNTLNETVYGHVEAKDQVLRILAQWITNPGSRGHCIGIQGPMGVGKSSLVKDGISKALNIPFAFIALGGASDGSFLEGFSVTYEGSTYGKIAEMLMKAQCMNPIIFFDELDKVSHSSRGDEIIGILTHLTDSVQNEKFNDKYFGEIDLDLSKCLFVFSYNDENLINPILRDRMIQIHVKGYSTQDKLQIAKNYLLPSIMKQYLFENNDIVFTDEILNKIIQRVPDEEGVRNLRRGIESIVSWLNMYRYVPLPPPAKKQKVVNEDKEEKENKEEKEMRLTFPIVLTTDDVNKYIKLDDKNNKQFIHTMYT